MTTHWGNESVYVGGLTHAERLEGWRALLTGDWRAAATDGAALANVTVGNTFNRNVKFWSFADSSKKRITIGDGAPFILLPQGTKTARLRFMWGQRGTTASDRTVRWLFQAIQTEDSDQIINATDADIRDVGVYLTGTEPDRYAYKVDDMDLTLTSWDNRPTMFTFGRNGDAGSSTDTCTDAALVYGLQLFVK